MTVQADELHAIRRTLAAYSMAGDPLCLEALAATFMQAGVLETPTATFRGREAIINGLSGGPNDQTQTHGARLSRGIS